MSLRLNPNSSCSSLARVVLERVLEPGQIVLTFDDLAVFARFAAL